MADRGNSGETQGAAGDSARDGAGRTFQETVLASLLGNLIPPSGDPEAVVRATRDNTAVPALSIQQLTANFRKFSSRVSALFIARDFIETVVAWDSSAKTLSFMNIYTLCCLHPQIILVLPSIIVLFTILIPAFEKRHQVPSSRWPKHVALEDGEATGLTAKIGRPVRDRDFLLNMRDIQNLMADYTNVYDFVLTAFVERLNFSDEQVSSVLFLGLVAFSATAALIATLAPFSIVLLLLGWTLILAVHPAVSRRLGQQDPAGRAQKLVDALRSDIILPSHVARQVQAFAHRHVSDETLIVSPIKDITDAQEQAYSTSLDEIVCPRGFQFTDTSWQKGSLQSDHSRYPDWTSTLYTRYVVPKCI